MKRTVGTLALLMMLSTQTLMPLTYATENLTEEAENLRGGVIAEENSDETEETVEVEEPVVVETPVVYYEVKFIDGGNETIQSIESGAIISEPETPEKEGYNFLGWYKENTCENNYDFGSSIVENTTIFACWEEMVEEISEPEVEEGSEVEETEMETSSNESSPVTQILKSLLPSNLPQLFNTDDKQIVYDANGGYFKDESETKTVIYTKVGDDYIAGINLQIPNKEAQGETGFMFAGWYTVAEKENQTDDNEWLCVVTDETTIERVYAKWLPFNDLDLSIIGLTGVKIMDRNMGAEEVAEGTYGSVESNSIGYYYQWGNNYGFKSIQNMYPSNSGSDLISNSDHDKTPWGPGNYYYSSKFIKRTSSPYRWDNEDNRNLWGGEYSTNSDIDKQGPCPEGYHVPDTLEWKAVYNAFLNKKSNDTSFCAGNLSQEGKCLASKLNLPFAGFRDYYTANVGYQGSYALYWSSSPSPNDTNAYSLYFNNSYVYPQRNLNRAIGYSVRCFKNSSTKTLTSSADNGEEDNEFSLRRWEPLSLYIGSIEKLGYSFIGWFYDVFFTNKVNLGSDTINKNTEIYAKWSKNPWYTYKANGGEIDGEEEYTVKYSVSTINDSLTSTSTYGGRTIDGASKLIVTLSKTDDYGKYHTVYVYDYIKTDSTTGTDYIARGVAGEINDISIEGNDIGFVLVQNGPPINMVMDIKANVGYETDEIIGEPSNPGYTFSGWYEGTTGDNDELIILDEEFDFDNTPVTQDRTFYAKWTPHTYTVTFDVNEGSGEYEDINTKYGEEFILPTPERDGYTFEGWLSEVDNLIYSGTIEEGTGLTTEDDVTVNLTAQWKLIPVVEPEKTTSSSSGGGRRIVNNDGKVAEQEHNSADIENEETTITTENKTTTPTTIKVDTKLQQRTLTRGEVAIMTNILLEVYPQLVEGKQELDDVTNACSNYADEQSFTKDEKKAITRLCKLSIMGIHSEDGKPLDEFMVKQLAKNDEFATVIERSISTYEEKDLSVVKDALKKLDSNEESVVFGTVYDVFMSIKNIFN